MDIGPKLTNDNLVFGYDSGYTAEGVNLSSSRFYKGPPHTNLVEEIDYSNANNTSANFFINNSSEEVDIPKVGVRNVKYVEYYNNRYAADGSVNSGTTCCPNLFNYFVNSAPYIPVDSSSNYTYSIIYKHSHDYHNPNFMYHYQKNSSNNTLTEGGVSSTNSDRRTHLGDGWYHAWGNIATQSTCTNVLLYSFLYNYGTVKSKYYVAAISFVKNTTGETYMKIPPHLMLEPLASVSNTTSLIDLKRTTDIDLTNVSHSEFAQPEFDGTDDYFTTSGLSTSQPVYLTFETVIRFSGSLDSNDRKVFHWDKTSTTNGVAQIRKGDNNGRLMYQHHNGTQWYTLAVDDVVVADTFAHITVVHNGTTATMYKNGVQIGTTSVGNLDYTNAGEILLGYRASSEYWKGNIPVFKVYETALSASEIKQNYNAYKNRFNI